LERPANQRDDRSDNSDQSIDQPARERLPLSERSKKMKSLPTFSLRPASGKQYQQRIRRALHTIVITGMALFVMATIRPYDHYSARAAAAPSLQCQYLISPSAQSFAAVAGTGNVAVLTSPNCTWNVVSNVPWITISTASSITGIGRVTYSVLANPDPNRRQGTITVANQTVNVTQLGTGGNACLVTPITAGQQVNGSLTQDDCESPVRIRNGVRPLADRYSFNGTGGQPVVITLNSSDLDTYLYLLDANGTVIAQNDDISSGNGSRIPSNNSFFTLPSSGIFTIEVTSFLSKKQGNYSLNLTSQSGGCSYALNPTSQTAPLGGGPATVNITTQAGCAWTVVSNNNWITPAAGGGTGSGSLSYTVAANPGLARAGSLTIAGLTFGVMQAGVTSNGCPTINGVNPPNGGTGSNVTISGSNFIGVTVVKFPGEIAAQFSVVNDTQITAKIPNGTSSGPIIIAKDGCAEAQTSSFTVHRPLATVSAASFQGQSLASESIVAAFGTELATNIAIANTVPLPTNLLGTTVSVRDIAGVERQAPLFFVAPGQINYQIPPGSATGLGTVTVTSGNGMISAGAINIVPVAPSLFTANTSGEGPAATNIIRVKPGGAQINESSLVFDSEHGRFINGLIDLGPVGDDVILVLFGTGFRTNITQATVLIGGVPAQILYAGPQGSFIGLDQVNVRLPRTLIGRGEVNVVLTVNGIAANTVTIAIK
jgi:uncharacterized protein (TIGR03437 family)